MRLRHTRLLWLGLITFLVLLATRVYWSEGFPYTHDGENHLVRFVNYLAALREGQWPPRFAPYVFSGYGFPVFVFNYPLANILALPMLVLKIHPEWVFRLQAFLALWLGAIGTWLVFHNSNWKKGAWFATFLFLFSSYLASLLVFRGSIGEIWSYGLAPISMYVAIMAAKGRNIRWWWVLSFVIAATLLAHNLFGLMLGVALFIFSIFKVKKEQFINWLISWLLGVGITLWFWLPALGELSQTVLKQDDLANKVIDNTLSLSQILFSPLAFGFSRPGPLDTLGFGIGLVFVALLLIVLALSLRSLYGWIRAEVLISNEENYLPLLMCLSLIILIWLSSNWSNWIWDAWPVLGIIQFPWRLLFPATLLLVLFGGWYYSQTTTFWRIILIGLLFIQIGSILSLSPADRFQREREYYLLHASTTLTRNENRPTTFTLEVLPPWSPEPKIATGEGKIISVDYWTGSKHSYQVQADTDLLIVEPTVYFAGWQTAANQEGVKIDPSLAEGLIAYSLPAASEPYQIVTNTGEKTIWRQIGDLLTLLSLLALPIWILYLEKGKAK